MDRTRTYSFPISVITVVIIIGGMLIGYASVRGIQYFKSRSKKTPVGYGNTIMQKRMYAIQDAVRQGKTTYQFDIVGTHPALGNN